MRNIQPFRRTIHFYFITIFAMLMLNFEMQYANAASAEAVAQFKNGDAKYKVRDFHGAIKDYTAALAIDPRYAEAYNKSRFGESCVEHLS